MCEECGCGTGTTTSDERAVRVPADELPQEGAMLAVRVDGTAVALARVDGVVHAFQDECTHMRCSLSAGKVDGGQVVCPCHVGTFDIATGAVVSGPPRTALRTWSVSVRPDGVELSG